MVSTLIDRHVKGPAHNVGSATGIEAIGLAKIVQLLHLALELLDVLESRGGLPVHLAHRRDVWRGCDRANVAPIGASGRRAGDDGAVPAGSNLLCTRSDTRLKILVIIVMHTLLTLLEPFVLIQ